MKSINSGIIFVSLFVLILQTGINAQETGLITSAGEGVPLYVSRVGEELVGKEVSALIGGSVLKGDELAARYEAAGGDPQALADCRDPQCAVEISRLLGLDVFLNFSIERSAAGYALSLTGVTPDGKALGPAEDRVFDIRDLDESIAALGQELAIAAGLIAPPEIPAAAEAPRESSDNTVETVSEEPPETDAAAEETTAAEAPAEPQGEAEKIPEAPMPEEPPPGYNGNMVFFNSGLGAMQLANFFSLTGFVMDAFATANYYHYMQASSQSDIDNYYGAYENYRLLSRISYITDFSLTGGGAASAGYPLFSGTSQQLQYSRKGRMRLYSALGAYMAGNLLYLNSMDPFALFSYNAAKGDSGDASANYYADQALGDLPWILLRGTGISALWGTGTWWLLTAPDQPGKAEPLAGNFWDKVLVGSGLLFLGGGNFFASMAGINRGYALYDWYEYIEGTGNIGEVYRSYSDNMDAYELMSTLAAASWITGAVCITAAEFFDFPDPFAGKAISGDSGVLSSLRFMPHYAGGALYVHLEFP